ncbi:MAG: hypothetical protein QM831_17095 [Kofleriaceae bacterium]
MSTDGREATPELRCVAPLVVGDRQLVGSCTIITNGAHAIAVASSEVLRQAGEPLHIVTRLDGSQRIVVKQWSLARHAAIGIIDLGEGTPFTPDVHPLHLGSLSAAVETRGAPAALVVIVPGYQREIIAIDLIKDDGGGMADDVVLAAKPTTETQAIVDGAPLFAWMPPDPVLGRTSEVIVVALGISSRGRIELVGLEDVGRALPWAEHTPPPSNELDQVAGEIVSQGKGETSTR